MEESDPLAFRADARRFVDQPDPCLPTTRHHAIKVIHRETHVMDARTTPRNEPGDRRFGRVGFEQFDQRFARDETDDSRAIRVIERCQGQPEDIAIEWQGIAKGRYGDAEMCDAGASRNLRHEWTEGDYDYRQY